MPNNTTHNNLHQLEHSDELEEIIGYIPHWTIRYGNLIIFFTVILLIIVSYLIKYPDTLFANTIIIARDQPQNYALDLRNDSIRTSIFVSSNQFVKKGSTLALEENLLTKKKRSLLAKAAGNIFITRNITTEKNQRVLSVVPKSISYDIQLKLPLVGAGRVKVGQQVLIKLFAFPEHQFGYLIGYISNVIPFSLDGTYIADVELTNGLVTNTGYHLPSQPILIGKSEIMVDEKRLIKRIFDTII